MQDTNEPASSHTSAPTEPETALIAISRWTRFISIIGFGIGAFVVVTMLISGKEVLTGVMNAFPVKIEGLYGALVFVFFIFFFVAAAFLYFLFKASTLFVRAVMEKNTQLIAEGFLYLKRFFWVLAIMATLGLFSNLVNLLK